MLFKWASGILTFSNFSDSELWEVTINGRKRIGRKKPVVFPAPTSGQSIRLRGGKSPYEGYVEIEHNDNWGFICDPNWTFEEANVVCKQLGFSRGLRSTTTGFVHGPVDEERRITDSIDCIGTEDSLTDCNVKYKSSGSQCNPTQSIVSVTCIHDSIALCDEKEVPWGTSCYSVHFNRSSFEDATETCQKEGKKLLEITHQAENDLLSELLLHSRYSPGILSHIWTGGKARKRSRSRSRSSAYYYWTGSNAGIGTYKNWWPGWQGQRKSSNPRIQGQMMGISLKRKFNFIRNYGQRQERLVDYYFWALEDLHERLPFICEKPQKDIGCYEGNGASYQGIANRGEAGDLCLNWTSPYLNSVLNEAQIANLGDLNHNHCRNPDNDDAPWCIGNFFFKFLLQA